MNEWTVSTWRQLLAFSCWLQQRDDDLLSHCNETTAATKDSFHDEVLRQFVFLSMARATRLQKRSPWGVSFCLLQHATNWKAGGSKCYTTAWPAICSKSHDCETRMSSISNLRWSQVHSWRSVTTERTKALENLTTTHERGEQRPPLNTRRGQK